MAEARLAAWSASTPTAPTRCRAALRAARLERRPLRRRRAGRGPRPQGARARAPGRPAPPVRRGLPERPPRRPLLGDPRARRRRAWSSPTRASSRRGSTKELDAARLRRRVGSAHHLLLAQQTIADHLAAGPRSRARCASACSPRSARRSAGASARSGGPRTSSSMLRPTAVWHAAGAAPEVVEFAEHTREAALRPRPGHARPRVGVPPAVVGPRRLARRAHASARPARCAPG